MEEEEEDVGWEMGSGGGGGGGAVQCSTVSMLQQASVRSITGTRSNSATRSSPENRK